MSYKDNIDRGINLLEKFISTDNIRENIDRQAEREGKALKRRGQNKNQQYNRRRQSNEYNITKFNTLFKGE